MLVRELYYILLVIMCILGNINNEFSNGLED